MAGSERFVLSNHLLRSAVEETRGWVIEPFDDLVCARFLREIGGIASRGDLLAWAQRNGRIWRYGTEEHVQISNPHQLPDEFESITGDFVQSKPFVCEVTDAELLGPAAIGVTDEGVLLETVEANRRILNHRIKDTVKQLGFFGTHRLLGETRHANAYDLVFPLVKHRSVNYYHWVFEYLRKLRALEAYREQTDDDPVILVAADAPSWVTESLELAGYDHDDLARWDGGGANVDRLVVPEHRDYKTVTPDDFRWLRDRMTANANGESYSPRIYVSRRDADHRRVVNENDLLDALAPLGFKPYVLEEMSFEEQVCLFEGAEVIVGPHGAGLTNMMFVENASVVELLHGGDIRPHYFLLANALSHEYDFVICNPEGDDMMADIASVRRRVEMALQSSSDL